MGCSLRVAASIWAGLFLLAITASAQLQLGDFSNRLSGTITSGYSADWGNQTNSDHGWTVGGEADLSGAFHSSNFLSYSATAYLNQSRANSDFQSISNASGVNISTTFMAGTHFPLSINYSLAYNSDGNYAVPGVANYVTHGTSDTFGISWSENIPDAPSFSASYQRGNSQYNVYGSNDNGSNTFQSLNFHSGYTWKGLNMGTYYLLGDGSSLIPQVISGTGPAETHSNNSAMGFNVSHRIPLNGNVGAAWSRSTWDSSYLDTSSNGIVNIFDLSLAIRPVSKIALSATLNYSDNLSGQLYQSIVNSGGALPGPSLNQSSSALDIMGILDYSPLQNLQTEVYVERRTQSYLGDNYGVTSYGSGITYSRKILNGIFNSSVTVTANTSDQDSTTTMGFTSNDTYATEFHNWQVNGSFSYAQNVQTLLVTYMNSFYNYSGTVRRRWGRFHLGAGASAGRTGLTQQPGTANSSESYNLNAGYGSIFTGSGSYSHSSGQALVTGAGLVPIPIPPIVPSSLISIYGGDSYAVSLASSPLKHFTISAAYSKSLSNTNSSSIVSDNSSNQINALLQYQFRKMNFTSGYARLEQGFSIIGTQPQVISSFYAGVSRWFKFF